MARNGLHERITRLRRSGHSTRTIASRLGCGLSTVKRHVKAKRSQNVGDFFIDADELARRCREVQAEWSPEERAKRAGWAVNPSPEVPVIPVPRGVAEPFDDAA